MGWPAAGYLTYLGSPCKQALTRHLLGQTRVNFAKCIPLTWKTVHIWDTFHFFIQQPLVHGLTLQPAAQAPTAARLICNVHVKRFDHITPTLFSLHWLPIRYRIQFKISLFTYKGLNGLAPAYITELLKRKTIPWYNLRSSDDKLLLHAPSQYKNSRYSWWPFIYRRVTKTMERSTCGYPPCH